jgi:hypothetical protein
MPDWKRDARRRLDALIVRNVPNVRKAVKCVKVTFFRGTSLRPVPPGGTGKDARWVDIHEDDLNEAQMATWIKQASSIPGWETGNGSFRRRT